MSILFQPLNIGDLEVKNRFVHSATHESMADPEGNITGDILRRYERLARGGIGLIVPGHMYVSTRGRAHLGQIGIHADTMVTGLRKLTRVVHKQGAKIVFQLAHGGRQCPKKVLGHAPLAPSGRGRDPISLDKPRQMDEAEIRETIEAFAAAAERAVAAGADGIQLHAAHGYLINEFLSPFYNDYQNDWGGTDEDRFRFIEAIIARVRYRLPENIPVLVKLNTNDYTPKRGITPALAATYARWMVDLGVAAIEISCGTYYGFQTIRGDIPKAELVRALPAWMRPVAWLKMSWQAPRSRFEEAYNLGAARLIKPAMNGRPLILVGGVRRLSQMENIVESGTADMIAMSRPFIREPWLVNRFYQKKSTQAACVSCNMCFAAMFNNIPVRCYRKGLSGS